jgi:hypothetical protein
MSTSKNTLKIAKLFWTAIALSIILISTHFWHVEGVTHTAGNRQINQTTTRAKGTNPQPVQRRN